MDFLTNVFHSLRGIDWFILVIIGGMFILGVIAGAEEGITSALSADPFSTRSSRQPVEEASADAWILYGYLVWFSTTFGLFFILSENKAVLDVLDSDQVLYALLMILVPLALGFLSCIASLFISLAIMGIAGVTIIIFKDVLDYYSWRRWQVKQL